MKNITIKAFAACKDGGDGSTSVSIFNTKQECLDDLGRTQKELNEGCYHDDGCIKNVTIKITPDGKLAESINIIDIE